MSQYEVGTAVVLITKEGTGRIQNKSTRNLWQVGSDLTSDKLKGYPVGSTVNVVIHLSKTNRRMIQSTYISKSVPTAPSQKAVSSAPISTPEVPTSERRAFQAEKEVIVVAQPKPGVSPLDGYYISPEVRMTFSAASRLMTRRPERAVKIMMVGESGNGKTTLPRLLAQRLGMTFMRMDCGKIRDSEEWFGYREAKEGSTVFIRSRFMDAITKGNLVVVLDEFNRLEPWLHNTLFPLLDEDGKTVVHDEEFVIGKNVLVVGTINNGAEYTGTFQLDKALLNRFEFMVEVSSIPHQEEVRVLQNRTGVARVEAERIVKMANALRQLDITCPTRSTLNIAAFVVGGLTVRQAFETAVTLRLPPDANGSTLRKSVADRLNAELGVFNPKVPWDVFDETVPPEPVKSEEAKSVSPAYEIEIHKQEGVELGTVSLISLLRELPVLTPIGREARTLTQREAQYYVSEIQRGMSVVLELSHKPKAPTQLAERLKACGVSGRLGTVKTGESV